MMGSFLGRALAGGVLSTALLSSVSGCFLPTYTTDDDSSAGGAPSGGAGTAGAGAAGAGGIAGAGGSTGPGGGGGSAGSGGGGGSAGSGGGGGPTGCEGGECLPSPPSGWAYVRTQAAAPGSAVPDCPQGGAAQVYYAPSPSDCTSCSCDWTGASCNWPQLTCYYGSGACGGSNPHIFNPSGSGCIPTAQVPQEMGASTSCMETAPAGVKSQGTCTTQTPVQKQGMWAEQRHVCAAPPAGPCDGGTCIPAGGGAFGGPVCVMQAGNMTCPPGYQGKKHLVYESGTDERSCGGCTCDLSQVVCNAAADYIVYDDDPDGDGIANNGPCGGMASQIDGCAPLGDKLASAQRAVKPPIVNLSGMKCLGGGSFGQVTGAGPRTICCE